MNQVELVSEIDEQKPNSSNDNTQHEDQDTPEAIADEEIAIKPQTSRVQDENCQWIENCHFRAQCAIAACL